MCSGRQVFTVIGGRPQAIGSAGQVTLRPIHYVSVGAIGAFSRQSIRSSAYPAAGEIRPLFPVAAWGDREISSGRTHTYPYGEDELKKSLSAVATIIIANGPAFAECDPNYDPCVPIASDVDCAGGSGNGPEYVYGPVTVIGDDVYGLDRDRDRNRLRVTRSRSF